MFTGLIEDVGQLVACTRTGKAAKLTVRTALPVDTIAVGDSIAVNGACLTVESAAPAENMLAFHTLTETLAKTNLGQVKRGGGLNLERALRLGDRLGGHLVSGHVDQVVPIRAIGRAGDDIALELPVPDALRLLVIPKGSIAVNGISLTIADLREDALTIHVIPHTWENTNLKRARTGDPVNIEADMIGKYILRAQSAAPAAAASGVTWDSLAEAGFTHG
jgi:riboflavin synthase